MDILEVMKQFGPMRVFANSKGEFYLPDHWIKEEGKLPRKKNGCTHYVKAGPNEKEIRIHYHNPDLIDNDDD